MDTNDRFWTKGVAVGECLEWSGARNPRGYGIFQLGRGVGTVLAHRHAYTLTQGPVPSGMVVKHSCDNRACIRPEHLSIGSQADNLAEMVERGRDRKARGEAAGKAKLTAADVKEIRRLSAAGATNPEIGLRFGVCPSSVWSILHRKHWAHVD